MLTKQSTLASHPLKQSNIIRAIICALSLGISSCSPGLFFGDGVDHQVLQLKSSRRINKDCGNMDVSTSQFTLKSFRGLVQCLNANQSMEPVARFVGAISDQDLSPIVDAVNQSLVSSDPQKQKRFYELERTYQGWVRQGIHQELFRKSGQILSYSDFWMSVISILRSGFYEPGTQNVNVKILRAIELLSAELDHIAIERSLRMGLTYAEAPSWVSLQTHLMDHSLSDAQVGLLSQRFMSFVNQPQAQGDLNQRAKFKAEITWAIQNDQLFPLLDRVLGTNQEQLSQKAPELVKVLQGVLATGSGSGSDSILMNDLFRAFQDLSGPVSCMKGSKEIKDATRYLIRELAEFRETREARHYITREAPLTFMALGPFCTLPPTMTEHYPAMFRLAESGVLEPMVDLLKVLYSVTRTDAATMAPHTSRELVATAGGGEAVVSGSGADAEVKRPWIDLMFAMFLDPGASHLTPILKTLSEKNAFLDLIFLSHLMVDADREDLNRLLKLLTVPQDSLQQQSIADVFTEALAQSSVQDVTKLVLSGRRFLDLPDGFLRNTLKTVHQAYFVNQVHPLLSLVQELGSSATTENRALFEAIFRISERHPEHLKRALEYVSEISQGGELADLTDTLFQVTRKMLARGRDAKAQAVHQGLEVDTVEHAIPALVTRVRHHLASVERENHSFTARIEALFRQWGGRLGDFSPIPNPVVTAAPLESDACKHFDFSFSLDQISNPRFQDQFDAFLACQRLGAGDSAQELVALMQMMNQTRIGSSENDPTFLAFQVDTLRQVFQNLSQPEVSTLVEKWMDAYDHSDRRFFRLLDAIPYWVSQPISRNPDHPHEEGAHSIAQSLLKVTGSVISGPSSKVALQELMASASGVLRRDDFPSLLRDLDQVFLTSYDPAPAVEETGSPEDEIFNEGFRAKVRDWLIAKEGWRVGPSCRWSDDALNQRVDDVITEAKINVNNRDLLQVPGSPQKKPRSSWKLDELKTEINPLLTRLEDQRMSDQASERFAIDSLSKFLRRYSRPSDVGRGVLVDRDGTQAWRTPEYLLKWFHDRSRDYQLIQYYYPGEVHPRVRAVNSLDRLELTLVNVDMVMPAPPYKNLAFQFLLELADAWGDEPRERWPVEIQRKYPIGHTPATLAQAVDHILKRKGMTERLEDLETLSQYVIGLPEPHSCARPVANGPEVFLPTPNEWAIRTASVAFPLLKVSHEDSLEFKRKLFNLWQVKGVLEENVPGSGHAHAGGMEVLRDLFFEIYYSTPSRIRDGGLFSPPAAKIQENNLNLITASARLGGMRQIGRLLQRFRLEDPLLKDIAMNVIQTGASPDMGKLMRVLVERDLPGHVHDGERFRLIWSLASLMDQASEADQKHLAKTLSHLLAAMSQLDPWHPSPIHQKALIDLLISRLKDVLREHYSFLSVQDPQTQDLVKSALFSSEVMEQSQNFYLRLRDVATAEQKTRWVGLLKDLLNEHGGIGSVLYPQGRNRLSAGVEVLKSVVQGPESWKSLKTLVDQVRVLKGLPEYQALDVYSALQPGLEFFEENTEVASHLRLELARLIYDSQAPSPQRLLQLLEFAHEHPNEFNQLLSLLGKSIERGDLQEFLKVVRRSLPNAEH